jgi:2-isopropylmalate synthase
LLEYNVHAVTEGIDAQGEVSVRISYKERETDVKGRTFGGYASDPDVIVASAKAYLFALNSILHWRENHSDEGATVRISAQHSDSV